MLVGEGYWRRDPDPEYLERLGSTPDEMTTHQGNIEAGIELGLTPRESWTSSQRDWDGYEELYARTMELTSGPHPTPRFRRNARADRTGRET